MVPKIENVIKSIISIWLLKSIDKNPIWVGVCSTKERERLKITKSKI
jgi:hypothetical protein